jgi:hypothetical protein
MSVSTEAILCFGVQLSEEFKSPWLDSDYGDFNEWWAEECGFKYDGYDKQREFLALPENKCPIELVWHCSESHPIPIIAIPGYTQIAYRGSPQRISIGHLGVFSVEREAFLAFCKKYNIEVPPEGPQWWLCSYWG